MISVILPACNAERTLARALAPLVSGVAEGLVKEAIVVDAGSTDETCAMAEAAGCRLIDASGKSLAERLIAGAEAARGEWLLFLPPEAMLARGWIEAARAFMERGGAGAAVFRYAAAEQAPAARRAAMWINLRAGLLAAPSSAQGLLLSRVFYGRVGGFREGAHPHADLVRRIGRARLTRLSADAIVQRAAIRASSA